MSNRGAIGFGGFLLGLGAGYIILRELSLAVDSIAWALIIIGGALVASALIRWVRPGLEIHRIVSGVAGGLVFALILTQGFNVFTGISNSNLPYSTTEHKTYTGASPQDSIYLRVGSMNGQITLTTWNKEEYSIEATITARGTSQKEADDNLVKLGKELVKEETSSVQKLTLIYTSPILLNNPYQISLEVKMPVNAKLDLDLTTSNGAVTISNVDGGDVVIHTSNGALRLTNIKASTLRGSTSNGPVTGNVDAVTCTLTTSNGPTTLQIPSKRSGTYTLTTSNGNVDVTMGATGEYRLDGTTSNAEVTFNIPNLTYSRDTKTSKAAQTTGYDSAQIQISVNIQTSNAPVTVRRNISGV